MPDVAADASVTTGMALAFSAPGGSYYLVGAGGTSAAAPFWAGLIALADQDAGPPRLRQPRHLPDRPQPAYHQAFHDVTTGTNTVALAPLAASTITGYRAAPGWDPVTGWGSPDAQELVPLLAHYAST